MPVVARVLGIAILAAYLKFMTILFEKSIYGDAFQSGKLLSTSIMLNSSTCAASLVNVASHSAVASGVLNDTYVFSILVGVGFDVITRLWQFLWWINITVLTMEDSLPFMLSTSPITAIFLLTLTMMWWYQMSVHIQALRMNHNYLRLQRVINGALNNLNGIPGEMCRDHLFAYTDLGFHLLPLMLSTAILQKQESLSLTFYWLLGIGGMFYAIISQIPFNQSDEKYDSLINIQSDGKVACKCLVCMRCNERKRHDAPASFAFNVEDGICKLWLCSFETLSRRLSTLKKT